MGKKILVLCMVIALLILLPVFSYAVEPPAGTEILDYIKSTGTQYFNTGLYADSNSRAVIDFNFNSKPPDNSAIFGSRNDSSEQFWVFANATSGGGYIARLGTSGNLAIEGSFSRLTLDMNFSRCIIGSNTLELPSSSFTSSYPMFLFGCNRNGTVYYPGHLSIYGAKFYSSSSLVRDFIPVRLNGNVGMWDKVEGRFYSNIGTGSFVAGSVVDVVVPSNPEYNISVSSSGNGSASSNVSKATAGTTVTLSATPSADYVFSEWQVLQGDIDIVNNQFIMPSSDVSVKAVFIPDGAHTITVQNDGFGTGSANPVRAHAGDRITLSAVPVLGYQFDKWQVVSGSVNISNNQFIMPDSDVVVKALFKPIVYTITLNQGLHGTATVSQQTGIIGDVVTLTATPYEKYNFSHWNIIQGDISIDNNQFIMPASNVVIEPVFLEVSAISSGFKYNSGRIDGSYSSHYDVLDIDFGDVPAGDYLLNIYHWGGSYNVRFGLYYGDKYLGFSSADGLSTTAIEHKGGQFRLHGGLDLTRASTVSAEAHVVWISNYGGSGTLDLDNPTTWTFNIEDVVLIPVDVSHLEDYGSVSSLVAFLRDSFNNFKGFLAEQIGRIAGDEEAEADVSKAEEELNKEVEDLNNLGGQLEEQQTSLETQFQSDFKVSDDITSQTSIFQGIYTGIFSSFGIFSIFIWLPVVLAVIKKLLRL